MRFIRLSKGKSAWVDDKDYEWLNQWKWHFVSRGYAYRNQYRREHKGKRKYMSMHRLVNNTPSDKGTDHINGNKLDNRKSNLRTATQTQNLGNQKKQAGKSSRFKGVFYDIPRRKWCASIKYKKRRHYLGRYVCEIVAAARYDIEAEKLFGQFAKTNF